MAQLCHCDFCQCRNLAQTRTQQPEDSDNSNNGGSQRSSTSSSDLLCLVCENARLWYKTVPTYRGCLCVCKCKLERAPGVLQCLDCLEENRKNRRRHRLHGKPKGEVEEESAKGEETDGSSP